MPQPILHTNFRESERGAASVEFALISIVLFTILFAIIEFGIFFSQYQVFAGAAREGARVAATRGDEDAVKLAVNDAAEPYDVNGTIIAGQCDATTVGDEVEVKWMQDFDDVFVVPLVPVFLDDLEMKGVFRCE